jgi:hypothetical protein
MNDVPSSITQPPVATLAQAVRLITKNHVIGTPTIYQGSANTAVIRVGELFREAVRHTAVAMIVVHNHPSGDPTPSPEDVAVEYVSPRRRDHVHHYNPAPCGHFEHRGPFAPRNA